MMVAMTLRGAYPLLNSYSFLIIKRLSFQDLRPTPFNNKQLPHGLYFLIRQASGEFASKVKANVILFQRNFSLREEH
jgi:hypothetical protein